MLDRGWITYAVKAKFAEKLAEGGSWPVVSAEELRRYQESVLPGWEAHVFRLANPILISGKVDTVLPVQRNDKQSRVYPPFPMNEKKHVAGAFDDIKIPEGKTQITSWKEIPSSAVKGMTCEQKPFDDVSYCAGLRIDGEAAFPEQDVLRELINQIAQYTHQWWLRSGHSPFAGPLRMGATINRDFQLIDELRYLGAGEVESTFHACVQSQPLLGIERPLTNGLWLLCLHHVQNRTPAETGLLSFSDSVAHYMQGDDNRCILDLALCFEILESKRQQADTGKSESRNKQLLRKSRLADGAVLEVLRKLIIDRDHVAHGRAPYIASKDEKMLPEYIEAVRQVVNNYMALVQPGEWPALVNLRLESTRRR